MVEVSSIGHLQVDGRPGLDVVRHIRNVHPNLISIRQQRLMSIVNVFAVGWVDGEGARNVRTTFSTPVGVEDVLLR